MPRLVVPPAMPQEVSHAIDVIGNRARATIIRILITAGPRNGAELAAELGANREAVYVHTQTLRKAGVIEPAPLPDGVHNATYWTVNRDRVDALVRLWTDYMAGK